MADEMGDYLRSEVLYWQMDAARPGGAQLPKLTIGGFLERSRRLPAATLSAAQRATLNEALRRFEAARDAYRPRYLTRVVHDLRGRLDAWAWFLDDYAQRPAQEALNYPAQAHTRLAIELLLNELEGRPEAAEFKQRLPALDEQLRANWRAGAFVWHPSLAHAFPREPFWWLYGKLQEPD